MGFPLFSLALLLAQGCGMSSRNEDQERLQNYRKLLVVSGVNSYYHIEPKTKTSYPLVRGTLRNLGSESLEVVEFIVKFQDQFGRVIYEERTYPVFLSEYSSASPQAPLNPSQSMRFALKFPSCPPQWKEGKVEIEVSKIVFQKHSP